MTEQKAYQTVQGVPQMRRLIHAVEHNDPTKMELEEPPQVDKAMFDGYVNLWLEHPLEVIRRQNAALDHVSRGIGQRGVTAANWHEKPEESGRGMALNSALHLNAALDAALYPEPEIKQPSDVSANSHFETQGEHFLRHGDILPGRTFELGKPQTYSRELLTAHKVVTSIFPIMQKAKRIGHEYAQKIAADDSEAIRRAAVKIHHLVALEFPVQDKLRKPGARATLGQIREEGGECRHLASTLQLALQEAGIRSRYSVGTAYATDEEGGMAERGGHAWVEVDLPDGRQLVLDPTRDAEFGEKISPNTVRDMHTFGFRIGKEVDLYTRPGQQFNTVWRPR